MLRLPASLERRLEDLFPKIRDREQFVIGVLSDALEERKTEDHLPQQIGGTLHLFTDGGSRGNPGQAAIGCIIEDPMRGQILEEYKERIGVQTNNVAEYRALVQGLQLAQRYQPNRLICHLDSELIVRQLNGEYQVKMQTLKPYFDEVQQIAQSLPDVVFTHIPREDNYRADALVNKALDELPAPHVPIAPLPQRSLFQQPAPLHPGDAYRESQRPMNL